MPRPPARRSSRPTALREASDAPSRLLSSLPALPAASFDPLSPWGFSVVGWSCNPFDEGTSSQIPPATPHSTAPTSIPALMQGSSASTFGHSTTLQHQVVRRGASYSLAWPVARGPPSPAVERP